jgi:hypothetical protein
MTHDKLAEKSWIVRWVYTREEWQHFEKWNARNKGVFRYWWYSLFDKEKYVQSVEFSERWIKISGKQKYFNGPVTELRRVDVFEKGEINIMSITYENISTNYLNEINIPIPRGKLKEAIEAQEKLMNNRK